MQPPTPVPPEKDAYVLAPPPPARRPFVSAGARATDALLAGVAHAAIVFGFFGVGFLLSLAINAGIWIYSKRSPYVEYHAKQAGCYQCFVLVLNLVWLFVVFLLGGFAALYSRWDFAGSLAGWLFIGWGIWFVVSILYGMVAAVLVLLGRPFAYPVFGRLAARR